MKITRLLHKFCVGCSCVLEILITFLFFSAFHPLLALPKHDPKLEGLEQLYYVDDFLFGNCTSSFSYPPPNLAWYINDKKADNSFLQPFHEEIIEAYGLKIHQRSLELRFRINEKTIPYLPKKIRLRCTSQLTGMPSELRDSMHEFNVETEPELRNQKLINWKMSSAGEIEFSFRKC